MQAKLLAADAGEKTFARIPDPGGETDLPAG